MASNTADAPGQMLLRTKLYAPPPRPDLVARPRLLARLDASLHARLTLLAASAGFGKTTLLSAWRAGPVGRDVPFAWVSLDSGDNDPIRFWHYLIAALADLHPGAGDEALALLAAQTPSELVVTALLNGLAALPEDALLVLDDYHVIEAPAIGQSLAFLIEHLPPHLHLVIASRSDPALPLARLRARGELVEIRAADLRFTPEEAASFLTGTRHLALNTVEIDALQGRTEGWIAGLQLAALSLQGREDTAAFVAAFTGSNRYIVDYLSEEVLLRLPAAEQDFLLRTAILDRLSASLCATMVGDGGEPSTAQVAASQALLEHFEGTNLFIVPLDGERRWYRYHHLFADLLRARLDLRPSDEVAGLHRRAAEWYERHGLSTLAINHTLAAGAGEEAARLIEGQLDAMISRGELVTLLNWMEALPEAVVVAHPRLDIYRAALLTTQGHFDAAAARLQAVAAMLASVAPSRDRDALEGELLAVHTLIAAFQGKVAETIAFAERAQALLPPERLFMRLVLPQSLGLAYLESGRPLDALRVVEGLRPLVADARLPIQEMRSRALLLEVQIRLGQLRAPAAACQDLLLQARARLGQRQGSATASQELLQLNREYGTLPQPVISIAAQIYGEVLREWNQLAEAEEQFRRGLELGKNWGHVTYPARGRLGLARLQQALGDPEAAQATLREGGLPPHYADLLAAGAARLRVMHGDVAAGAAWVRAAGLTPDDLLDPARDLHYRVLARVLIAQQCPDDALTLLARLDQQATEQGRQGDLLEILLLRALAQRSRDDLPAALAALTDALTLAEPEGYLRSFLDEGGPLLDLLTRLHTARSATLPTQLLAYVARLLAAANAEQPVAPAPAQAAPSTAPQPLPEPLGARELEVLRLMADGLSNQEIAARLFIAVSTVKWYVNSIFGKLAATSRTQAVAKARTLALLDR
jgi:LuxR family maltose regulon positive regulatory protein